MTALAPILESFFTDRLMTQRSASPHTIASYRDTFTLLLGHVHQQTGKVPAQLDLADLDAPVIGAFLQQLETTRGNTAATRNARLAFVIAGFFLMAAAVIPVIMLQEGGVEEEEERKCEKDCNDLDGALDKIGDLTLSGLAKSNFRQMRMCSR